MSGKRNVSVCSGHELANALYTLYNKHAKRRKKLLKNTNPLLRPCASITVISFIESVSLWLPATFCHDFVHFIACLLVTPSNAYFQSTILSRRCLSFCGSGSSFWVPSRPSAHCSGPSIPSSRCGESPTSSSTSVPSASSPTPRSATAHASSTTISAPTAFSSSRSFLGPPAT